MFKSTVPWGYFKILVLLVIVLSAFIITSLSGGNTWLLFLFLIGLVFFFWSFPRMIDLQRIPGELELSEGIANPDQLKLRFEESDWEEKYQQFREKVKLRRALYLLLLVALMLLLLSTLRT